VAVYYPEFGDFCDVAAGILGTTPEQIARFPNAGLAESARATGAARSTARAWLAHTRSPTGERAERLIELSALVERLARVMEPSYIAVWLRKPVPALAESKPIDVIASGNYVQVAELVSALEEAPFT
jgi:uncharacterized protein (DUF2384 family)